MAEERDDKPTRRTEKPAERDMPSPVEGLEPQEGAKLATEASSRAMEDIRDMGAGVGVATRTVGATAAESDVTNELTGGGVAFGEFVKSVGLAVAAAQAQLDQTLVDTAKALSAERITTVAVFEQQIDDDTGEMKKGEIHLQELPLTNYLMPTAYHWSRVYLEADMNVQEFNSRSGFDIQQRSFSADARVSGGYGLMQGGWGFSGSAGMSYGSTSTGVDASYGQDVAAGKLHMEATLEPRGDVELPRPFVLQKGPRMQVRIEKREDVFTGEGDARKLSGRKCRIKATLRTSSNAPNTGKELRLELSEPTLNWKVIGTDEVTNNDGTVTWEIERQGTEEELRTPVRAVARVSFGLVTGSAAVQL